MKFNVVKRKLVFILLPVLLLITTAVALIVLSKPVTDFDGIYAAPSWIPNDTEYEEQWGLSNQEHGINVEKAWDITRGSTDVKVGLMEDGIIADHEDLDGRILKGNFTPGTTGLATQHGTMVAGVIGAISDDKGVAGVAQVSIVPLKYDSDSFASSLRYAEQNGIKVINASYSYRYTHNNQPVPKNNDHRDAIKEYNGLIICAAGNDNTYTDADPVYPAGYGDQTKFPELDNVISVGATTRDGLKAMFSNFGEDSVPIYAPGKRILSTFPPSAASDGYGIMDGTSFAAPHVAGVAALLLSINPNLTGAELKRAILDNADEIEIFVTNGSLHYETVKFLNAYEALKSVAFDTVDTGNNTVRIDTANYIVQDEGLLEIPSVIEGKTVTEIGDYAFFDQWGIKNVIIPDTITRLGESAFEYCRYITSVSFPQRGLTHIGAQAFYDCEYLRDIRIPSSLKFIGKDAFLNTGQWNSHTNNTIFTLPTNGTSYGGFWAIGFKGNTPAVLTLNAGIYGIADGTFENKTTLTKITIPLSVSDIGARVFYGCTNLQTVNMLRSSYYGIPALGSNAFYNCPNLSIVVPNQSSAAEYKTAPSWSWYGNFITYG